MATSFQFLVDRETGNYKTEVIKQDGGKMQVVQILSFMGAVFFDVRDWFTTATSSSGGVGVGVGVGGGGGGGKQSQQQQLLPTKRGVRLSVAEWQAVCEHQESISEAISMWHSRRLLATPTPTPVLESTSEAPPPPLGVVKINDRLKLYVVPACLAPHAKKTDCGVRVVFEKLSNQTTATATATTPCSSSSSSSSTAVAITPQTWYRLMQCDSRDEIQSIITALRVEIAAASARKQHESLAAEAALFKNCLDLSQL
jgi:hypothetical protein